MKKLPFLTAAAALAIVSSPTFAAPTVADLTEGSPYFYTVRPNDTAVGLSIGQKATTDSGINHLPVYYGNFQTNNTYRFVNIQEQVFTMIGDGKHGLYRYQDNGTIREYITDEAEAAGLGLSDDITFDLRDPNQMQSFVDNATASNPGVINSAYTHFDESASFGGAGTGGYKSFAGAFNGADGDPTNQNGPVNSAGNVTFIDLPITHPKYEGRYDDHPPIDLAGYYCTMSAADYPRAQAAMNFAFAQPGANKVGPLGVRAGLDIRENYLNVLKIELLPDANIWANTGDENDTFWQEVDTRRTKAEIYLVERPFFNEEFLFVVAVFDNSKNTRRSQHSYVRPDGAYFDSLRARKYAGERIRFRTRLTMQPRFNVVKTISRYGKERKVRGGKRRVTGTYVFGLHHPGGNNQDGSSLTNFNSACPGEGGDFGEDYWGSAWPNNYQEVTPLCDAVTIDIKFFANLDGATWRDEGKNLANAGTGTTVLPYINNPAAESPAGSAGFTPNIPGDYGTFQDPYVINSGLINHEAYNVFQDPEYTGADESGTPVRVINLTFPFVQDQVQVVEELDTPQDVSRRRDSQN